MLSFIEHYLRTCREKEDRLKLGEASVHSVVREVKHYSLACHLLWALWSAVNANFSKIPFGYWEFAEERFENYLKLKNEILAKQNVSKEALPVKRKMTELED